MNAPRDLVIAPLLATGCEYATAGVAPALQSHGSASFGQRARPASPKPTPRIVIARAAAGRELLSHRLNRFLYAHVLLVTVTAFLPLMTPGDAFARGASWWLLHAVLYAISLSALLLGLSSAHAEAEEFTWLLGHPAGIGPWLAGKATGLALLVGAASLPLALPAALGGGGSTALLVCGVGAALVSVMCAMTGLAIGFWVRDSVRGLIAAMACWFALLFGSDLLLLGTAGNDWAQAYPDLWVLPLMVNPLDAFRVTVLFSVERAAFTGFATGRLTGWWISHALLWLTVLSTVWIAAVSTVAWLGARRRLD